jgi:hypothetical protein
MMILVHVYSVYGLGNICMCVYVYMFDCVCVCISKLVTMQGHKDDDGCDEELKAEQNHLFATLPG